MSELTLDEALALLHAAKDEAGNARIEGVGWVFLNVTLLYDADLRKQYEKRLLIRVVIDYVNCTLDTMYI
jgi:hypothetical protein